MKQRKMTCLLCMMMGLILMVAAGALATEDPLLTSMEITPRTLPQPAAVRVAINVVNGNERGEAIEVTLRDPAGEVCKSFGAKGTANLAPGASASFAGSWKVTAKQLQEGRLTYSLAYTYAGDKGEEIKVEKPVSVKIESTSDAPTALMRIERTIAPGANAKVGEQVTVQYVLENVGTTPLHNITILDPEISEEPLVLELLPENEQAELMVSYIADAEARTTHAEISYEYTVDGAVVQNKSFKADPAVTIQVENK